MTKIRWSERAKAGLGFLAGFVVIVSALWLLGVYIQARRVDPADKAVVDTLKTQARHDRGVQTVLLEIANGDDVAQLRRRTCNDHASHPYADCTNAGAIIL